MTDSNVVTILAARPVTGGPWTFEQPDREVEALTAAVASRIPVQPPVEWFDSTQVPEVGGPLTFTADGRVYGLLAPSNIDHIGLPRPTRAPKSRSGYSMFHTGQVRCDDGSLVSTGRITMMTGHEPDVNAGAQAAAAHYDNTGTAVADVIAWDTPQGVMCAGAARPGLTGEQIRMAMASPPSGDWRPIKGSLEMVGALLVNVPGFPTDRAALAASGEILSLVASGAAPFRIVADASSDAPNTDTEEAVVAAPPPPPAKKGPPPAPPREESMVPPGVEPGMRVKLSGEFTGVIKDVDEDEVGVEITVPAGVLEPADEEDAVAASAVVRDLSTRLERAEAQLRDSQAERLLASVPAPE